MGMSAGGRKGFKSEINITPYIDILLVLLIIFMVVTPIRQHELRVRAPQPAPPRTVESVPQNVIVVAIGENAQIEVNQIPTDIAVLGAKLRNIFSMRANRDLFISASPSLPYGDIVRVIDISKGAGAGDVGLLIADIRRNRPSSN